MLVDRKGPMILRYARSRTQHISCFIQNPPRAVMFGPQTESFDISRCQSGYLEISKLPQHVAIKKEKN